MPIFSRFFSGLRDFALIVSSCLFLSIFPVSLSSQTVPEPVLEIDIPIERELPGVQEHEYRVSLNEGQYARLIFEQRGVDAIVQLLGADGKSVIDFDHEVRLNREETIQFVAPAGGDYRLLVKGKFAKFPGGPYAIRLAEVRDSTENDRLLDEVRRLQTSAWQLRMADKFPEALPVAEKALELQERVLGQEHGDLVYTLFLIAVISEFKVDYPKAEAFYSRGQAIAEKTLGPDHPLLARGLSAIGYHYFLHRGDYARAEQLFLRALSIYEKVFGPDHPQSSKTVRDFGFFNFEIGDYAAAESYLQRALVIYRKAFGDGHSGLALAENYLAGVYTQKGDYEKAESLYRSALASWEKEFGVGSGWATIGVANLANLFLKVGDLDRAEPLLLRSLAINQLGNPPHHPAILTGRFNLADLYLKKGDLAKVDSYTSGLLPALEKTTGPNHRTVGLLLHVLGRVHLARNNHAGAESQLRRALSVLEAAAGPKYHTLADIFLDLGAICVAQGRFAEAVELQRRANEIIEYNLNINLATGSERQKLAYLASVPEQLDQAVSLHASSGRNDGMVSELASTVILQRKGRVQDAMSNSLSSLRKRLSGDDKTLLDRLNILSSRMSRLVLEGPQTESLAEHQKRVGEIEVQRETLENEIGRRSAGVYERSKTAGLAEVQANIAPDAALIEFAVYTPFDPKTPVAKSNSEPRYVAYVLKRSGAARLKDLGPAKVIDDAVGRFRRAVRDPRRRDVAHLARTLDEKVMRPMRELLGDATHLLISPDGELNLVPFEAFADEKGQNLIESYSISYVTSGRDLVRMQVERSGKGEGAVVANPVFGEPLADSLAASRVKTARASRRRSITNTRNLSDTYFAPLSGTSNEANSIKALFPDVKLMTGASATETAVKALSAPKMLHIATHGFFLDERSLDGDKKTAKSKIENPLLRSGLAFAGANSRSGVTDDGILTAMEASGLDLWGTKLVVLSACDTGIGEIRNGEGVYGLRRSFALAGAESLVMSMWPVSDYVTRELMVNYYKNLKKGMGRGEALRQVQLEMIKRPNRRHPFYWASFIQSGDWANLDGMR